MYMDDVRKYSITLLTHTLYEAMNLLLEAGYLYHSYDEDKGLVVEGDVDPTMFFEDMNIAHARGIGNYYIW